MRLTLLSRPDIRIGRVKTEFEMYGVSTPTLTSSPKAILCLPDVIRLRNDERVDLTCEWQEWHYQQLLRDSAGTNYDAKIAFKNFWQGYRAYNNGTGWRQGLMDCINGINIGAKVMQYTPSISGGAVIGILEYPRVFGVAGEDCWKIITMNGKRPPPSIEKVNETMWPEVVFSCVVSCRAEPNSDYTKWGREDLSRSFGYFGAKDVHGPLLSNGDPGMDFAFNFIPCNRVVVIEPGEPIPSPYKY